MWPAWHGNHLRSDDVGYSVKIKWIERDTHDDRCSAPSCRRSSTIMYSKGATAGNKDKSLQFCDSHQELFILELRRHWRKDTPKEKD